MELSEPSAAGRIANSRDVFVGLYCYATLLYCEEIARTWTYQILYRLMAPPRNIHGYTSSTSPESQNADDRPHIKYYISRWKKQHNK